MVLKELILMVSRPEEESPMSGIYIGFKVCQIQWHWFQVSMICGS